MVDESEASSGEVRVTKHYPLYPLISQLVGPLVSHLV